MLLAWFIWPFTHFYLAQKYSISPWKLCGFAMYTTPHLVKIQLKVELYDEADSKKQQIINTSNSIHFAKMTNELLHYRIPLGKFFPPDKFGEYILKSNANIEKLTIIISTDRLNGKTCKITPIDVSEYNYQQ